LNPIPFATENPIMSTQNLTTIALDVASRYSQAGDHLGRAYRAGVARAVRAIDERFEAAVRDGRALPLVDDTVKQSLIEAHKHVSGAIAGGLIAGSERACELRGRIAEGVKSGIERVAAGAADTTPAQGFAESFAAITLPSAQFSLAVANAVADGAKRIDERVSTETVADEAVVVDAPARKRAAAKR
jgi:hypothetical protein